MITIHYPLFREKLALLAPVMSVRTPLPQLSCVKMSASDERLTIQASNLEQWLSVRLPADGYQEPFCVDLGRVRMIPASGDATLSESAGKLQIEASGIRATIQTLPATEFPAAPLLDSAIPAIPFDDIRINENLEWVNKASSTDESSYALCGVHMEGGLMVASNRHVFFSASCPDLGHPVTIPKQVIPMMVGIAAMDRTIRTDGNRLELSNKESKLSTSLIDAGFPNWQPLIAAQTASDCNTWSFDSAAMIKALKDTSSLWREDKASTIRLRGSETGIEIECGGQEASTVMQVAGAGGPEWMCNGNYMLAALAGFSGEVEMDVHETCSKIEQDGRMALIIHQRRGA
jgi:DNA polymerase III sliding clamp (beta) subunit (PCNA family)